MTDRSQRRSAACRVASRDTSMSPIEIPAPKDRVLRTSPPGIVAALAALLVVVGCRPEPLREGLLVAALTTDASHLNPAITTAGGVHTAAALLYNGLVALDEDLQPVPELAKSWTIEEEGARYRFHLRRDVRWHDGARFTSADVKFAFDSVLLRFHARTRASLGAALDSIETPDDSTVVFRFKAPYAVLLQQLNVVEAPIVPRHLFVNTDPTTNPATRAPVGTGPYRFVSHTPDSEIRYVANADYFGGAPAIDRIVMRVIPDGSMQVVALESGEVDWLFGVPGPDRARLVRDTTVRLVQTTVNAGGSNCVNTLVFNLDQPVFADGRVRRAVAHGIDRQTFLERVEFGVGRVATKPISSRIPVAQADDLAFPAYDTLSANRLLDTAGWRRGADGVRTADGVRGFRDGARLRFRFTHMSPLQPYGDLLRAQLRQVGIEVELVALEPAVFAQVVFTERDFDTGIVSYCNGTDPEVGVRRMYVSSNIAPVPFSNGAGYRSAVMDSLWDAARAALDPVQRRSIYEEIQRLALRDLPYLSLIETAATRAHRTRCAGFRGGAHFAATARCGR